MNDNRLVIQDIRDRRRPPLPIAIPSMDGADLPLTLDLPDRVAVPVLLSSHVSSDGYIPTGELVPSSMMPSIDERNVTTVCIDCI
jgi:hypothetical protein